MRVTQVRTGRWQSMVAISHDPEITDDALGSEIELLADVINVASDAQCELTEEQIDTALGIAPHEAQDT